VSQLGRLLIVLSVFLSVLGGAHYYVWARLIRDPRLPSPWFELLSVLVLVLFLSIPLALILGRRLPQAVGRVLARPSYIWLGSFFLLFVSVVFVDALKAVAWSMPWTFAAEGLDRQRAYGLAAALLGVGGSGWALLEGYRVRVRRVEVPLARLPRELDGLSIVQLTDVHIGPSLGAAFARQIVAECNRLEPDVVVITGDLVDAPVARIGAAVKEFGQLRSKYGTYFVTGNHEYYSGVDEWCQALSSYGIRVLRNERVSIGEAGCSFDLAGIDDLQGSSFAGHGPDLKKALLGRDATRELVLLAHQPRVVNEAAAHGVGLQLSGHTHGGQLWPFSWLVRLQQPFVAGLARRDKTWVYVSRGTGYWGPPMRLGAPAEIAQVVLRHDAAATA
jgi:predicted MPP superfamily phosphohydrolase